MRADRAGTSATLSRVGTRRRRQPVYWTEAEVETLKANPFVTAKRLSAMLGYRHPARAVEAKRHQLGLRRDWEAHTVVRARVPDDVAQWLAARAATRNLSVGIALRELLVELVAAQQPGGTNAP